ncbi:MAG TPA: hypothetical protein VJQ80_01090 [Arthrobacter sp.]|nr:hypothetical protein [Arthrobacter sp.]
MPAAKYTQEQKDAALALYETHGPTAVQEQLGIPKTTVASWAKNAGVRTVRTEATRKAVEAKVVDGKLRRQNIAHRLYGQAEDILDVLEAETFTTLLKGEYGSEHEGVLSFVPANERKTLIQALGSAMVTTAKLESIDSADDTAVTDSVVDRLVDGFTQIYRAGRDE